MDTRWWGLPGPAAFLRAVWEDVRGGKNVLLFLTTLMGISGIVIGLASGYAMYMVGRALIGVVVGGFWSLSAAVAWRICDICRYEV